MTVINQGRIKGVHNPKRAAAAGQAKWLDRTHLLTASVVYIIQDQPRAVAQLITAAAAGRIEHVAAQLRAQQIEDEAVAKRCAELAGQGITVVEVEPRRYDAGPARPLDALRAADAPPGTALTEAEHAGCPGHAAYVSADYYQYDPDADDEDPGDGDQADELELTVMYLCTDPDRYGHWPRHGNRATSQPRPTPGTGDDGDEDEASTAADLLARQDEARKAERRALIRLNKEADAAEAVRREFLRQCVTVKSRHKAMAAWALSQVVNRNTTYSLWAADYYQNKPTLAAILGADPRPFTAAAPANLHGMILWTHVVCAHEESLPRDAHRQCDRSRAAYLSHLQTLGYVLSAVEQQIIDNTQQPAEQQPADQEPADQEPADQEPAEQEPAEQEPAEQEDQEVSAA